MWFLLLDGWRWPDHPRQPIHSELFTNFTQKTVSGPILLLHGREKHSSPGELNNVSVGEAEGEGEGGVVATLEVTGDLALNFK